MTRVPFRKVRRLFTNDWVVVPPLFIALFLMWWLAPLKWAYDWAFCQTIGLWKPVCVGLTLYPVLYIAALLILGLCVLTACLVYPNIRSFHNTHSGPGRIPGTGL